MVSLLTKTQIPVVVMDLVMLNNQLSSNSVTILRNQLIPVATLVIVTLNETAIILERDIISLDDMKRAAQDLHLLGPKHVLIKGDQNTFVVDVLFDGVDFTLFKSPHLSTTNAYGARCTLSAAITAYLARGLDMGRAIQLSIAYTHSTVQNLSVSNVHHVVNDLPENSVCRTEKNEPLIIDKEQQQTPPPESSDKVVLVSSELWIHEPRILLQKRSFVQLLKNACLQEWVCAFPFFCIFLRGE